MYRTINDSLWSEPWLERLSKDARLLFVNLLTSPRQTPCGVVEIGVGALTYQTGLTADELASAFHELDREQKVIRWADRDLILVRRFFAWQRTNSSHNYTVAARRQLATLPTEVAAELMALHPELREGYTPPTTKSDTHPQPIPNPSPTQGDKVTTTATAPTTESATVGIGVASLPREPVAATPPVVNPPVDHDEATAAEPATVLRKPPRYSPRFEAICARYPTGSGMSKAKAHTVWKGLRTDAETDDAILTGIEAWKRGKRWQEGFVMALERWLRERNWEVAVEPWTPAANGGNANGHAPTGQRGSSNGAITPIAPASYFAERRATLRAEQELLRDQADIVPGLP